MSNKWSIWIDCLTIHLVHDRSKFVVDFVTTYLQNTGHFITDSLYSNASTYVSLSRLLHKNLSHSIFSGSFMVYHITFAAYDASFIWSTVLDEKRFPVINTWFMDENELNNFDEVFRWYRETFESKIYEVVWLQECSIIAIGKHYKY